MNQTHKYNFRGVVNIETEIGFLTLPAKKNYNRIGKIEKTGFGLFSNEKKLLKFFCCYCLCAKYKYITKTTKLFETFSNWFCFHRTPEQIRKSTKNIQDLSKYETTHVSLTCCLVHISYSFFYSFISLFGG